MLIEVGKSAPDFVLSASSDKDVRLSDFRGKKVVLYFYSKNNTTGCTKQAVDLKDNLEEIEKHNAIIVGVSPDKLESHQKFIEKYQLPFILLSDHEKQIADLFKVYKEKKICGKVKMGIERSIFIIDENGIIQKIYRKVDLKQHIEQVLGFLEEISNTPKKSGYFLGEDFHIFASEDFKERMSALKEKIRPKLQELGGRLAEEIKKNKSVLFPHVAKHARRTVNPPEDTWVALSHSKLGYKKLPHFEVGLNLTSFYIKLVLKPECDLKKDFALKLRQADSLLIPFCKASYLIYGANTNKMLKEIDQEELNNLLTSLETKKNTWLAIGLEFPKDQVKELEKSQLIGKVITVINKLYPLYELSVK